MEIPRGLHITFVEGPNAVGRSRVYVDPDKIYEILRAAKSPQEDHHAVSLALQSRRPGSVELKLSPEQYDKLCRRK